MDIKDLAPLVLKKRGNMGVRAAAKEIGISPTTLTRIEKGNIPDHRTLEKLCEWIGETPMKFTGVGQLQIAFKGKKSMPQTTAQALSRLIQQASTQFLNIETKGH